MSRLALYLLGPPIIELDGESVHIGRRKAVALLAYLAVTPGSRSADTSASVHRRDTLATLLWPDYDQSSARAHLRRALVSLTNRLGSEWFAADRESIGLNCTQRLWLDVDQFRERLATCDAHATNEAWPQCQALITEATELYRDDFLAGFSLHDSLPFDEWHRHQTEALRDDLCSALERLSTLHAAQEEYKPAIAAARRWLALDPLREAAHRCLMRLYTLSDQKPAALRQYQECQRTLKEELGVPPSPQTVELMERIRAGESLEPIEEPAPIVSHNLPPQPTRFIGRERELAELDSLISDTAVRLITIVGPGGIGKTRLALAVAEGQLHGVQLTFPDGVFFVPLARMSASDEMAPAVAEALDFQIGGPGDSRSARQQVLDYLREKRMLLVLDNFEHLLPSPAVDVTDEGPGFVADVLHTAAHVQLLVTSRERLPLRDEQAFPINGLECVDEVYDDRAGCAAEQLFLQAARRAEPSFKLATDEAACLSHICRLLEGMPLAIELAANWVDVLSVSDIATEIQSGLDFLSTDWQDAPARHRSVHAAIDTSWRRLTETEQAAFAQLCVFRGGFTREAAREVPGADLRTLVRLADKSLLHFNRARQRYEMHELLRQYGCERLAADPELENTARDRHSAYYCDALGRWGEAMNRGVRLEMGIDFEADWTNLRVAWGWAADRGDAERLDLALDGLFFFIAELLRFEDGEELCQRAIAGLSAEAQCQSADHKRVLAKGHLLKGDYAHLKGQTELVRSSLQQAKALLEDPDLTTIDTRAEQAYLHAGTAGLTVMDRGDLRYAQRHFEQSLALVRALGYEGLVPIRFMNLGWMHLLAGSLDQARDHFKRALEAFDAVDDQFGSLMTLRMLGQVEHQSGNRPEAERCYSMLFRRANRLGRLEYQIAGLLELAVFAIQYGNYDRAEELLPEYHQIARQRGMLAESCEATRLLGETAWFRGDVDSAERWLTEALELAERDCVLEGIILSKRWLSYIACARGDFERAERLCEESLASLQQQNAFITGVLQLALARVSLFRGDPTKTVEQFHDCLQLLRLNARWDDTINALECLSWALAALKRYDDTAQLLGFLTAERERTSVILPPVDRPLHERALRLARDGLSEEAFAAAWEAGAALTLGDVVEFAMAISV